MPDLFGIDIAKKIGDALGPKLLPVTWTKVTIGTRTADNLTGGTNPTTTAYSCRGVMVEYQQKYIDGSLVRIAGRSVLILAATISPSTSDDPKPGDKIAIEGTTYRIGEPVTRDPARATFVCPVKGKV